MTHVLALTAQSIFRIIGMNYLPTFAPIALLTLNKNRPIDNLAPHFVQNIIKPTPYNTPNTKRYLVNS